MRQGRQAVYELMARHGEPAAVTQLAERLHDWHTLVRHHLNGGHTAKGQSGPRGHFNGGHTAKGQSEPRGHLIGGHTAIVRGLR